MASDIEVARAARLRPIGEVAEELGLGAGDVELYGSFKAKLRLDILQGAADDRSDAGGRLVLITGMTPTAPGEGKTTVATGLVDGLRYVGRKAVLCLREPSVGPVFGSKGGAAGGGRSQVVPMEDINLHFTGDLHAIGSAHALLSAMLDNHLHRGNELGLDVRRVVWPRAVDSNDRALRNVIVGLGGPRSGVPREEHFVITAASELMAIFCLASDLSDLEARIGRVIVGYDREGDPVRARDLGASGAMTMLLKDALQPNLVQTLEGSPAFIHGGPFANIAHGCNSLVATRMALALGEVVVTEAGFGTELGAEKFCDIKCRIGNLQPSAAVIVATVRALKWHGGADDVTRENVGAVRKGMSNLEKHVENVQRFGVPAVVAINRFPSDTREELRVAEEECAAIGVPAALAEGHARGGEGMVSLAEAVECALRTERSSFEPLYDLSDSLEQKITRIATAMYGAEGVDFTPTAQSDLKDVERAGLSQVPVCMAKTPFSLSDDAALLGRPSGFRITVSGLSPSAGAGFVVARTGSVLLMPGLPVHPAAEGMGLDAAGQICGLA